MGILVLVTAMHQDSVASGIIRGLAENGAASQLKYQRSTRVPVIQWLGLGCMLSLGRVKDTTRWHLSGFMWRPFPAESPPKPGDWFLTPEAAKLEKVLADFWREAPDLKLREGEGRFSQFTPFVRECCLNHQFL